MNEVEWGMYVDISLKNFPAEVQCVNHSLSTDEIIFLLYISCIFLQQVIF